MVVKYLRVMRTQFANLSEYKFNFFGDYLGVPIKIVLLLTFWNAVFSLTNNSTIGGLALYEFIFYVGMSSFMMQSFSGWHLSEVIDDYIKEGHVTSILTRPISFIGLFFAREAAYFLTRGVFGVLFFGGVGAILGWYEPTSPLHILLALFSYGLAMILHFLLVMTVSLSAFFILATWGIRGFMQSMRYFFSGELIPLTVFPSWLSTLASYLPFKYTLFVPLFIYLEQYSVQESIILVSVQLLFIAGFWIVCEVVYRAGVKRNDAQGG